MKALATICAFCAHLWTWLICDHADAHFQRNVYFAESDCWRSMWLCPDCGRLVYRRPVSKR